MCPYLHVPRAKREPNVPLSDSWGQQRQLSLAPGCCGNLCTVFNGIFSAKPHVSCVKFSNVYEICLIISVKKTGVHLVIYIGRDIAAVHDA